MTAFVIAALVMTALALLWLLPALLRHRPAPAADAAETNLAVLRDQVAELERDATNGLLSPHQLEAAREDLERRVLEDARVPAQTLRTGASKRAAVVLALALPLSSGLIYWALGNPDAMLWKEADGGGHAVTSKDVEEMAARLAARLEANPNDGNGWALLGRSYMVMQRFDDASAAYARAAALITDDAGLLADYADALGMQQGRRIDGRPLQVVEQALKIDPANWKALAMAGSAAFERKDYRKAIAYWEKLQSGVPPDSDFSRSVAANIQEARELGGIKPGAAPKAGTTSKPAPAVAAAASVRGGVSLAAAFADKAAPSDTVFIYARAAAGPRMPLAIVRMQVKDLPATFALDDSQAMSPETKLSNFSEVVVGARISKSGSATPQRGDLVGLSPKIKPGAAGVSIVIDQVVP